MTKSNLKIHKEPRMNKILNRLLDLANSPESGFTDEEKAEYLAKIMKYRDDEKKVSK